MEVNSFPLYLLSYRGKNIPDWTRTSDHRFRKPMLYPTELREFTTELYPLFQICQVESLRPPPEPTTGPALGTTRPEIIP